MGSAKVIAIAATGLVATGILGSLLPDSSTTNTPATQPTSSVVEEVVDHTPSENSVDKEEVPDEAEKRPSVQPAIVPKPAPKPTPKPAPKPTTPSCSCPAADLDCAHFSSCSEAQSVYRCCLSQGKGDWHDLDRDSDGTACDTLCR